ncbi:SemiSWEET transporter [Aureitalea marina]|uniref:Glutathione synthetase n=1 Tax=Aureitalea marina TaxID=930804 RepID=A0A2S7KP65_9FLAO|nr:SemiSWEET transporter [Aureitalea marina]PQB04411.1 hypothetical protein BST85_05490 [Aureitalea marina]
MQLTSIIGNAAAFLTTISFLPQALKIIRSGQTRQLSLPMYLLFVSGVTLWVIYGIQEKQLPIILGNAVTLVLSGTILIYKLREVLKGSSGL